MAPSIRTRAQHVLKLAGAASLRLATAESCTGGALAALLTGIEDLSHCFERGYVAYTEDAKMEMLGVERAVLERASAVSAPCAEQMAAGALALSGADVAVSITGYAGGRDDPEPGRVFFGLAARGARVRAVETKLDAPNRARMRLGCVAEALSLLEEGVVVAAQARALSAQR